jgi:hypothetical protein
MSTKKGVKPVSLFLQHLPFTGMSRDLLIRLFTPRNFADPCVLYAPWMKLAILLDLHEGPESTLIDQCQQNWLT